jgi:predicted Zn-dependent protease
MRKQQLWSWLPFNHAIGHACWRAGKHAYSPLLSSSRVKVCLLWLSLCCWPAAGHANHGDVVALVRIGPQQYMSIVARYHIPIRYYVSEEMRAVPINVSGRIQNVDARPYVQRALQQWAAATANLPQPLGFVEVQQPQDAELAFRASDQDPPDDTQVMSYYAAQPFGQANLITLIPTRLSQQMLRYRPLFHETPTTAYIGNIFATALLHGIGHALGLDHLHEQSPLDATPSTEYFFVRVYGLPPGQFTQPHIMTASPFHYLLELEARLQRTVVFWDVAPAEAENALIRFNLQNGGQCMQGLSGPVHSNEGGRSPVCFQHDPSAAMMIAPSLLLLH